MNGYAWGAVVFVVVFLGLGVLLVFLLFSGRGAAARRGIDVEVGGVPVTVGG